MKNKNWAGFLLVLAVVVALSIWLLVPRSKPDKVQPPADAGPVPPVKTTTAALPTSKLEIIRREQMADWDDFTNRFEKRFKPEIARWCKVYAGRVPFDPNDVTPDKFHSKVGGFLYTFMIGSTTFTVYDGPQGTRVFYMMSKAASQELNSVGNGAIQHDITVPANRQVITGLLKADSGIDYSADQVSIHPTGQFSSMQGGVMVEAGGIVASGAYRIMTFTNLDFVLDGNGQLVSYQH
jgi:hypothetical protein